MAKEFENKKSFIKAFNESFEELAQYNGSEENLRNCEPFEQLNQKYISLIKQYSNSFHELSNDTGSRVSRREYSNGGEVMHRGFYSPSMLDLVVGGMNRGRLLKRPRKGKINDYEYLFDAHDNLICVYASDEFKLTNTEFFVHSENKVLSFVFNTNEWGNTLSLISECHCENGRLIRYEVADVMSIFDEESCNTINVEISEYAGGLLQSFLWYRYIPDFRSLEQQKFVFSRDEEGYLSTYTVKNLSGFKAKSGSDLEKMTYEVRVKRK